MHERPHSHELTAPSAREWWLRAWLVLTAPSAVFAALRDDSPESASLRSEPVLLIVILSGMAFVLSTSTASHLMDDSDYSGLLVAVWAFLAGAFFGLVTYFLLGAVLYGAGAALGSQGSYRRARHVLAFALAPTALSLLLWPVKVGVYGSALFKSGGSDHGTGIELFTAFWIGACVWSGILLVIGIRAVHGWTWGRAGVAAIIPLGVGVLLALA